MLFRSLALNNIIGKKKELNFNTTPFAIMLKRNPDLSIDKNYSKYTPLRKLNISGGLKLDSSFNFNGFSSGIKYSIIDKRDASTSQFIFDALSNKIPSLSDKEMDDQRHTLSLKLQEYVRSLRDDADKRNFFASNSDSLLRQDMPLKKLDPLFRKKVNEIVADENLDKLKDLFKNQSDESLKAYDDKKFNELKKKIKNSLLWTIGISDTTYKDKFQFSNIVLMSEISQGMFQADAGDNTLELNAKAAYNFSNDTLREGRNLKREIFTTEAGLNWVIRDKTTDISFFETKFSGTYYHNFASLYNGENRDSLTLNLTLRFKLIADIWVPLEVKYDPKSGNIFGFLNIKANFSGLGKLLKQSAKQ